MRTQQWSLTITDTAQPWLSYSVVEQAWLNKWDRKAEAIILSTVARDDLWKISDEFATWLLRSIPERPSPGQPMLPPFTARRGRGAHTWGPLRA
jgi:hypothetical protein